MSRFLSRATAAMTPYTPGEQPQDKQYIKLNTNECPYPPSPLALGAIGSGDWEELRRYPDPQATDFRQALADYYRIQPQQVFAAGGSDELLAFAFMAFFDRGDRIYFPDITYGFYKVYADLFGLDAVTIPLREDFSIGVEDYIQLKGHIVLAQPNAPTGMAVSGEDIVRLLEADPNRLVIVDEAYIDFADTASCVRLIGRFDNLLVVQTFSKSRALAGMRLGAGFGDPSLMAGLERIKYSFNPYNLDRVSLAVGAAAIGDRAYVEEVRRKTVATRQRVTQRLAAEGFEVLPSQANFVFARYPGVAGDQLYRQLKEQGILVRHFAAPRIEDFVRISIGTDPEMDRFLEVVAQLVGPQSKQHS